MHSGGHLALALLTISLIMESQREAWTTPTSTEKKKGSLQAVLLLCLLTSEISQLLSGTLPGDERALVPPRHTVIPQEVQR